MAGLGRRTFAPGEVLTASNVMNYLQDQVVQNYAGTAARGSAIGSAVSQGMVSYLDDSNSLEVYKTTGTAVAGWEPVNLAQSPNVVINGAFDNWQRGTAFSGNVYTADRFYTGNSPSAVSRSTDVPDGFTYSIDITGANHLLGYRAESIDSVRLRNQRITVSFWGKSVSGSNTVTLSLGTPSATDNFAISNIEYNSPAITLTTSWVRYSATFPALSADIAKGLFIYIFRNGSTGTDRTRITGVQVEAGQTATPFRRNANSLEDELAACQRYYYDPLHEITALNVAIATGHIISATVARVGINLPVTMRATPSISGITVGNFYAGYGNIGGNWQLSVMTITSVTKQFLFLEVGNPFATMVPDRSFMLYRPLSSGIFPISAEL
jgi:hypothetical protein